MSKTVFITGASSGFGNLTAKKFQNEGWSVFATMRSPEKENELNQLENITVYKLDVTNKDNIKQAFEKCIETYGQIDVLVNNAGYGAVGFIEEASQSEIDYQMNVNFFGLVNCCRVAIPYMRERKSGTIINLTSLAGTIGVPFFSLYNASKFAVEGFTQSLQFELGLFGIKAKVIAPGAFKTKFANNMHILQGHPVQELDTYRNQYIDWLEKAKTNPPKPFGYGDPQVVADLIYKCSTQDTPVINYVGKDAKMMTKMTRWLGKQQMFKTLKKAAMPDF